MAYARRARREDASKIDSLEGRINPRPLQYLAIHIVRGLGVDKECGDNLTWKSRPWAAGVIGRGVAVKREASVGASVV